MGNSKLIYMLVLKKKKCVVGWFAMDIENLMNLSSAFCVSMLMDDHSIPFFSYFLVDTNRKVRLLSWFDEPRPVPSSSMIPGSQPYL